MSRFEQILAYLERVPSGAFPGKKVSPILAETGASDIMAEHYGQDLHRRANGATDQAMAGKIKNRSTYSAFLAAVMLNGKETHLHFPREVVDDLTKSVVEAVCRGEDLQEGRRIFRNVRGRSVQVDVISAYRKAIHDDGAAPTLAEVRREFLKRHAATRLPKAWSFRNMLTNTFNLPLGNARRGRPVGSKTTIGNRR